MRCLKTLVEVIKGNAVVITKKDDRNADVSIGNKLNKQFVLNSLIGAVKAMML